MGSMSGVDHDISAYRSSCSQEINRIESELHDKKRKLANLMAESRLYKIFKSSQYKERKNSIECAIREIEKRLEELNFEMRIYKSYGLNIPQNLPDYEKIMEIIRARDTKLDIILLVEMGLM